MPQPSFWRRTPPALFPATLGMFGLALGWMNAARILEMPGWPAAVILASSGAFYLFAMGSYLAKIIHRPSAVFEDLNPVPGRAAVSAGSMCMMMLAAGLLHIAGQGGLALWLWWGGLLLHVVYMLCVTFVLVRARRRGEVTHPRVSPVLFLPYVGYIVAPIAGVPLGFPLLSTVIYFYALVAGAVILSLSAPCYLNEATPRPARPAAVILLAPTSLGVISGAALGYGLLAALFLAASIAIAALLLVRIRWLTDGGFTPLWGAFTFPSAAFAGAVLVGAERWSGLWDGAALAVLFAATLIVITIWALTLRAWAMGRLAPATGAVTA